jgi:PilZ domain
MPGRIERIGGDRRSARRYYMGLELRWSLLDGNKLLDSGAGRTVEVSSGGVLFKAGRTLPVGLRVELSIAWPVRLQGTALLQLRMAGRIVRTDGDRVALETTHHEFRTAGPRPEQPGRLTMASGLPFRFQTPARP